MSNAELIAIEKQYAKQEDIAKKNKRTLERYNTMLKYTEPQEEKIEETITMQSMPVMNVNVNYYYQLVISNDDFDYLTNYFMNLSDKELEYVCNIITLNLQKEIDEAQQLMMQEEDAQEKNDYELYIEGLKANLVTVSKIKDNNFGGRKYVKSNQ